MSDDLFMSDPNREYPNLAVSLHAAKFGIEFRMLNDVTGEKIRDLTAFEYNVGSPVYKFLVERYAIHIGDYDLPYAVAADPSAFPETADDMLREMEIFTVPKLIHIEQKIIEHMNSYVQFSRHFRLQSDYKIFEQHANKVYGVNQRSKMQAKVDLDDFQKMKQAEQKHVFEYESAVTGNRSFQTAAQIRVDAMEVRSSTMIEIRDLYQNNSFLYFQNISELRDVDWTSPKGRWIYVGSIGLALTDDYVEEFLDLVDSHLAFGVIRSGNL